MGNPVITKVFGITVAGDGIISVIEGHIHLFYVIFIQQIICIKDKKSVVIFQIITEGNLIQQVL